MIVEARDGCDRDRLEPDGMITSTRPDEAATRAYLDTLFGTADHGYLAVWTAQDRRTRWFSISSLDTAVATIADLAAAGHNVNVGMGLHPADRGPWSRGAADSVVGIPGAWDDLDILGPAHSRTDLPPSPEDVVALLAAFPLPYSLLIDSGHGLYPLWLFREVWSFDGDDERRRAASLVARVQHAIRTEARRRGYGFETTSDLARVLRPVGAINRKLNLPPAMVQLVADTGARYAIDEIEEMLPDEELVPSHRRVWTGIAEPRADLDRILAGCAFMRHCRDAAATLDEPAWHAMLSIVARCRDGERHAHILSAPYPRYDPRETQQKYETARRADKPLRCVTIRRDRGGERSCATCPHQGRITSPVVLGSPSLGRVQIGRFVPSRSGPLRPRQGVTRVG